MNLFRACHRITAGRLRISRTCLAHHSTSVRDFKVTLDGDALYIDKDLAEALGWTTGLSTEGLPLRLSGWEPHYFVITRPGTDAGLSSIFRLLANLLTVSLRLPCSGYN